MGQSDAELNQRQQHKAKKRRNEKKKTMINLLSLKRCVSSAIELNREFFFIVAVVIVRVE